MVVLVTRSYFTPNKLFDCAPVLGHIRHLCLAGFYGDSAVFFVFGLQADRLGGTGGHTEAAANAATKIDLGPAVIVHLDCAHLAAVDTFFAASARLLFDLGEVI